ncbi:MAG: EamA family transporter RarD [Nakamurella sp.]
MKQGALFAIGAYLMWGLFPLYWPLLEPAGALEILAHRMLWSAVVMGIVITVVRQWRKVRALSAHTWLLIALAALLISLNWGVYIYAVNNGHVVEASLGYFINPLVSVALGVIALRERLSPLQWIALAVAVVGVVFTSLGAHGFPYIAVTLALSFGLYGLIKRIIRIPAAISLLGESAVLMLPALGFLIWLQIDGSAHFIGYGGGHMAVIVGAGLVTAVPLLLFGAAARRLPLSMLGLIQYINPLTQFLLGVLWAHEAMSTSRWAGFAVIWVALVLLSLEAVFRSRIARRRRSAAATPASTRGMKQSGTGGIDELAR